MTNTNGLLLPIEDVLLGFSHDDGSIDMDDSDSSTSSSAYSSSDSLDRPTRGLVDYDDTVLENSIDKEKANLIQEIVEQKTQRFIQSDEYKALTRSHTVTADGSETSHRRSSRTNRYQPEIFRHEQLKVDKLVGTGGFSDVFQVRYRSQSSSTPLNFPQSFQQHQQQRRLVVKTIGQDLVHDEVRFAIAAIDLVKEALLLSLLDHPNIIKTVGVSDSGIQAYGMTGNTGGQVRPDAFFLVLPQVDTTLQERLIHWEKRQRIRQPLRDVKKKLLKPLPPLPPLQLNLGKRNKRKLLQRLSIALQLADAMTYLHHRNIIHRDLKPSNIGVTSNDEDSTSTTRVQLFDFGRACILPRPTASSTTGYNDHGNNETFKLTAKAGSTRYISPENWLGQPYNLKSDVYSFALIIHYLVTLQRPFDDMTSRNQEFYVFRRGVRPQLDCDAIQSVPKLSQLLDRSWSQDPLIRPTMNEVYHELETIVSDMEYS